MFSLSPAPVLWFVHFDRTPRFSRISELVQHFLIHSGAGARRISAEQAAWNRNQLAKRYMRLIAKSPLSLLGNGTTEFWNESLAPHDYARMNLHAISIISIYQFFFFNVAYITFTFASGQFPKHRLLSTSSHISSTWKGVFLKQHTGGNTNLQTRKWYFAKLLRTRF